MLFQLSNLLSSYFSRNYDENTAPYLSGRARVNRVHYVLLPPLLRNRCFLLIRASQPQKILSGVVHADTLKSFALLFNLPPPFPHLKLPRKIRTVVVVLLRRDHV